MQMADFSLNCNVNKNKLSVTVNSAVLDEKWLKLMLQKFLVVLKTVLGV